MMASKNSSSTVSILYEYSDFQDYLSCSRASDWMVCGIRFRLLLLSGHSHHPMGRSPCGSVFSRFLLGFIVVSTTMIIQRQRLQPKKYHYLIGRTVANTIAVFCFYKAVEVGSVAEANILNMTYPLFVALFSWFFLRNQRDMFSLIIVGVAFAGIWMVLSPGDIKLRWENLWGLSSGVTAAAAIIYLNISRRYHDSQTILFFMFGLGMLIMLIFFHDKIFMPDITELFFLLSCSVAGVLGQYLLTYGFFYVTAVNGSIISSSRILLAALFGPLLVADPHLTIVGWCGALLIFAANAALALRSS
jgi:drug/metabolite transporter (DMT)-like permease